MFYYRIHGLKVASDYRMEAAYAIPAFSAAERDVWVHEGVLDEWLTTEPDGEKIKGSGLFYRYEKTRGWVRAIGNGCFLMQNRNEIIYQLKEGHEPLFIAEVILCLCLGIIIIQKGRLIIHGSGILWGNRAVIISGQSGSGKSTLAQAILRDGGIFMSDDAAAVVLDEGKAFVYPGYPQQKLTASAAKAYMLDTAKLIPLPKEGGEEKFALRFKEWYAGEKEELHAMIILRVDDVEHGKIKKITGSEKLKRFTDNLYKYNAYKTMGFSKEHFMASVQIASQIELYELIRPVNGLTVEEEVLMLKEVLRPA